MKRVNVRREEEMLARHAVEKKRLPKIQKSEMKTRQQLFKQSLRISQIGMSAEHERDKIRQVSGICIHDIFLWICEWLFVACCIY